MSPLAHVTDVDQGGGAVSEVTAVHLGSPDRLKHGQYNHSHDWGKLYLIEVTSQPLATAALQMREPRKPFPPATTNFLFAAWAMTGKGGLLPSSSRYMLLNVEDPFDDV